MPVAAAATLDPPSSGVVASCLTTKPECTPSLAPQEKERQSWVMDVFFPFPVSALIPREKWCSQGVSHRTFNSRQHRRLLSDRLRVIRFFVHPGLKFWISLENLPVAGIISISRMGGLEYWSNAQPEPPLCSPQVLHSLPQAPAFPRAGFRSTTPFPLPLLDVNCNAKRRGRVLERGLFNLRTLSNLTQFNSRIYGLL